MSWKNPLVHQRTLTALGIACLLALGLSGCLGTTQGTLAVYVRSNGNETFTEVEITFSRVSAQQAGTGIGDGPGTGVERGAGGDENQQTDPRLISDSRTTVDLLQFQLPGSRALVGSEELSEGTYDLVIFRIAGDLSGTLRADGSQVDIRPRTNEIREAVSFDVEAGETTRVIIEIDLEEGIEQNDQGEYRFSPRVSDVQVQQRASGGEEDIRDRGV